MDVVAKQEHYLQTLEECRRVLNMYDDNFFRPRNVLVQFKTDHLNGLRDRKTSFEKDIEVTDRIAESSPIRFLR